VTATAARTGPTAAEVDAVATARTARAARRRAVVTALAVATAVALVVALVHGQTTYSPWQVLQVLAGRDVPGASFTVGRLRLPRAVLAVVAGLSFGLAGVTFQTVLRNPLASPDVIGITSGAGAAAVFAIVVLGWSGTRVSATAVVAALGVAVLMHLLALRGGVSGTRLILIGIGVAAIGRSATSYVLSEAGSWEFAEALRWLTGSLNGASWDVTVPALVALAVLGPSLLLLSRDLSGLLLGDDTAAAIGVRVQLVRGLAVLAAVGLLAFATAACGPIAFVSFLAGPIAARLVGPDGSLLVPAALVGALLVLVADLVGQFALGLRYPVGVVTGVLGAPYLVYLIVRVNRSGGAL
jgi:iron complex transport system permease protein